MLSQRQSSSPQGVRNSDKTPSEVERHLRDTLEGALMVSADARPSLRSTANLLQQLCPSSSQGGTGLLASFPDYATDDRGNMNNYLPFVTLPTHIYVNTK